MAKKVSGYSSVDIVHQVEPPSPPPANIVSKFENIEQWLLSICNGIAPDKSVDTYEISSSEAPGNYILCLVGTNTEEVGNRVTTRIAFRPPEMFYKLAEKEYQHLTTEEIRSRISKEAREFTTTKAFKESFLAKANTVWIAFSGEKIWSK